MKYYGDAEITGKATVDGEAEVKGKLNSTKTLIGKWTDPYAEQPDSNKSLNIIGGDKFCGNVLFSNTYSTSLNKITFDVPTTFNNDLIVNHYASEVNETYNFNVGEKLYYLTQYYGSFPETITDLQLVYCSPGSLFLLCKKSYLTELGLGKGTTVGLVNVINYKQYKTFFNNSGNIFAVQESGRLSLFSWRIICDDSNNGIGVTVKKIANITNSDTVDIDDYSLIQNIIIKIF